MQKMSMDDQHTQNEMIHLDTEVKLLDAWMTDIVRMTNIMRGAETAFGPLGVPEGEPPKEASAKLLSKTLLTTHP